MISRTDWNSSGFVCLGGKYDIFCAILIFMNDFHSGFVCLGAVWITCLQPVSNLNLPSPSHFALPQAIFLSPMIPHFLASFNLTAFYMFFPFHQLSPSFQPPAVCPPPSFLPPSLKQRLARKNLSIVAPFMA